MKNLFLALILFVGFISCKKDIEQKSNITIYFGGPIITMTGDNVDDEPFANNNDGALVVKDGKILHLGRYDDIKDNYGTTVKPINLNGKTLMPGLFDAHCHFTAFSLFAKGAGILPRPDGCVNTIDELQKSLVTWREGETRVDTALVKNTKLTGWIFGMGFDESQIKDADGNPVFPTKADLDEVCDTIPIMIVHNSGHIFVANSKGMAVINDSIAAQDSRMNNTDKFDQFNKFVDDSLINIDTGVFKENAAFAYMTMGIEPSSDDVAMEFVRSAQDMALSYGYTTAHEGRVIKPLHDLLTLADSIDSLKIDVVSYIDFEEFNFEKNKDRKGFPYTTISKTYKGRRYRAAGMKITLDGSCQGRTAWRSKRTPYLDPATGEKTKDTGVVEVNVTDIINVDKGYNKVDTTYAYAFKKGYQIISHANGDAAVSELINSMNKVLKNETFEKDPLQNRNTLIHGQFVQLEQLDSLKQLNVIASLFPLHTYYWGDWYEEIVGDAQAKSISPTKSALNKGLTLTLHTDSPVTLPNLMRMIGISVDRRSRIDTIMGKNERLTPYEALKGITITSAYQHFEEDKKGSLEVGKLADMVILSDNPVGKDIKPDDSNRDSIADVIKNIKVLNTIKEGEIIYTKDEDEKTSGCAE